MLTTAVTERRGATHPTNNSALLKLFKPEQVLGRLVRYGAVSAITTTLSLALLGILLLVTPLSAAVANFLASSAGIGPSYLLNRKWVWRRRDRAAFWKEAAPFWLMCVAGLVLSTVVVTVVSGSAATWPEGTRTAAVLAANVGSYAFLWLLEFLIIERLLFGRRPAHHPRRTTPHE